MVTLSHSIAADLTMWDPTVPALTPRYRVLGAKGTGRATYRVRGAIDLSLSGRWTVGGVRLNTRTSCAACVKTPRA